MPQFFTQTIECPASVQTVAVSCCRAQTAFAIARNGGVLELRNDQGELLFEPLSFGAEISKLAWQPNGTVLAVGFTTGSISTVRLSDATHVEDTAAHSVPITLVAWSGDGSRLVTGDNAGVVVLWKVDPSGRAVSTNTYRKTGIPTECVFLCYPGAAVAALTSVPTAAAASVAASDTPDAGSLAATVPPPPPGSTAILVAGDSGVVSFCNDSGTTIDVLTNLHSAVDVLEFSAESSRISVITRSLLMTHLLFSPLDGKISALTRAKISIRGSSGIRQRAWVGGGVLATATPDESMVRCWNFGTDDHYTLASTVTGKSIPRHERLCALAFNGSKALLAAGGEAGALYMWRRHMNRRSSGEEGASAQWEPIFGTTFPAGIVSVDYAGPSGVAVVHLANHEVLLVSEASLRRKMVGNVYAIQLSNHDVAVERRRGDPVPVSTATGGWRSPVVSMSAKSGMNIRGVDASPKHLLLWNGKVAEVYPIPEGTAASGSADGDESGASALRNATTLALTASTTLKVESSELAIAGESIYACTSGAVLVYSMSGLIKHTIAFSEADGNPVLLDSSGKYLAIATTAGKLRVYDISRVEPRQLASGGFEDPATGAVIGQITAIRVNFDGSRVAILAARSSAVESADAAGREARTPDTSVYVYGVDTDRVAQFEVSGARYPVYIWWDELEHRLLSLQTERMRLSGEGGGEESESKEAGGGGDGDEGVFESKRGKAKGGFGGPEPVEEPDTEVLTLFVTNDGETTGSIIQQDSLPVDAPADALLGISTPYIALLLRPDAVPAGGSRVSLRSMRDFVGMEGADEATRKALTDFSYFMATGNMDEAYKAVKLVANPHIWENMAQMCVKTKRLDVAAVCFGHMAHARGARAVRECTSEPENEANVAQVAVQLGMISDAARLYQQCGRYDKLTELYRDAGAWDRAIAVATRHDRVHAKSIHYEYAQHLERTGDTMGAIKEYEAAGTYRIDVPRMLHEAKDYRGIETYVNVQNDKELNKWYGQYMEARGDPGSANVYYQRAGDILAMARLACAHGDVGAAVDLVNETNDPAAAYHVARHLEAINRTRDALNLYEKSGRFNHAVRLAKKTGSDAELMTLALQASRPVMIDAAQQFESRGQVDKAVQLYHRGGAVTRAIDLSFRSELFDELSAIAEELGEKTNPELLRRCAEFFMSHGHFDKAVNMLIRGKRFGEAVDMCAARKVPISESMAEAMTPPKVDVDAPAAKQARTDLLMKLAKVCKKQGSFHLATKKYTQAGNKLKAMKSLLKSGDTEKIIFFANVSRSGDVYVAAANYLQTLPWHADATILKNIIDFYTKAKAYEQLSNFYEACAAVEIDEFRLYEKALAALKESLKHADKIKGDIRDARLVSLQGRIAIMEKFVAARKVVKTDPLGMVEACNQLLEMRDADTAVRIGDVYAVLIYYFHQQKSWPQAHTYVEQMRSRGIQLDPFLEPAVIEDVYRGVGIDPVKAGVLTFEADDDGAIGEEIETAAGAGARKR